jgi:hypothetical protein
MMARPVETALRHDRPQTNSLILNRRFSRQRSTAARPPNDSNIA